MEIPVEYKGIIIGKEGATLRKISEQTGAEVSRRKGEVYIISGTEHQREQAKVNIGRRLVRISLFLKFQDLICHMHFLYPHFE